MHTDSSDLVVDPEHPLNYTALATQTEGYFANDLKDLVARAVHRAAVRLAEHEDETDFQVSAAWYISETFRLNTTTADFVSRGLRCSAS